MNVTRKSSRSILKPCNVAEMAPPGAPLVILSIPAHTHQKYRGPKMTSEFYTQGVSETFEILTVTGADRRSFSDDCNLGVYTSRYAHPSPILPRKSIPACARPIGPALSTPVAVTQGEGVGGEHAAILASDMHSIYEYGLCMHVVAHVVRFGSVHRA